MAQNRVYLGVASNVQPEANIFAAMTALAKTCRIVALSRCLVTDAIPAPDQPPTKDLPYFINCVALVETSYEAIALKFDVLRTLEAELGRVRDGSDYQRCVIDLDILLFNDAIIQQDQIQIPDPDIKKRWFLAQGILDITPDLKLPKTNETLQNLAQPILDKFHFSDQTFREDTELREKILAITT